jgi:hypothetical protein
VDFPSVLVWFLNDEAVAQYTFPLVGDMDEYPFHPTLSAQFTSLLEIVIVEASQSNSGHHFSSTMRTNLSALREAGVMNISCGNVGTKDTYALNFTISEFITVYTPHNLIFIPLHSASILLLLLVSGLSFLQSL